MGSKNNYPIKYCVMGLRKFSHYDEYLEPVKEVYAYVVAKCYLISEAKVYKSDGTFDIKYGVVPTWTQNSDKENVPQYGWNGECVNAIYTTYAFSDVDSAKRYSRYLNKELCEEILSSVVVAKQDDYSKELEYNLQEAYKLEEEHLNSRKKR